MIDSAQNQWNNLDGPWNPNKKKSPKNSAKIKASMSYSGSVFADYFVMNPQTTACDLMLRPK